MKTYKVIVRDSYGHSRVVLDTKVKKEALAKKENLTRILASNQSYSVVLEKIKRRCV